MLAGKFKNWINRFCILLGLSSILFSLNFFGNISQTAYACTGQTTAANWKKPTLKERVEVAHTVLEGKVVQVIPDYVIVEVQRYFKNSGPDRVKISGFRSSLGGSVCDTEIELGEHAIIFAKRLQDGSLYVRSGPPEFKVGGIGYDPKEAATPQFVNSLLEAVNPKPVLPSPPSVNKPGINLATNQPAISQSIVAVVKFWHVQLLRVRS